MSKPSLVIIKSTSSPSWRPIPSAIASGIGMAKSSSHFPMIVSATAPSSTFVSIHPQSSMGQAAAIDNFEPKILTHTGRNVANTAFCRIKFGKDNRDAAIAFARRASGFGETATGIGKIRLAPAKVQSGLGRGRCVDLKRVGRLGTSRQQEKCSCNACQSHDLVNERTARRHRDTNAKPSPALPNRALGSIRRWCAA